MSCLEYIEARAGKQQRILLVLHEIITSLPQVTDKIRYKIPFYDRKSWVCYLNPLKEGGVELCFLHGNELSNEQGLLDFKGRKQVAGISYFAVSDIREEPLLEILQEALLLDEEHSSVAKKKK